MIRKTTLSIIYKFIFVLLMNIQLHAKIATINPATTSLNIPTTITPGTNNILYINKNVSGGNNSGDSWANAIPELADALKYANEQDNYTTSTPLKIFVAGGTYKPMYSPEDGVNFGTNQNRDNSFLLVKNAQIYGGFAGTEATLAERDISLTANKSILSGDIGTVNNNSDNTYHVVVSSGDVENALLNGFTIADGQTLNTYNSLLTVNSLSIDRGIGAGILNSSSSPTFTYIKIINNTANIGSAIYNKSSTSLFTNVLISNNPTQGGGVFNENAAPIFTNATIVNNTYSGGFNINNRNSFPVFKNCIIFDNINASISNTVNSVPTYKNSIVQGLSDTSNGNINANLITLFDIFTDPINKDYTLALYSPAVNTGDNTEYTNAGGDIQNDRDVAGNKRLYNGFSTIDKIDLGAIEYQGENITPNSNNIVFVDNRITGGNKSGNSWENAVSELAVALKYAKTQGNYTSSNPLKIFAAKGTYKPMYRKEDPYYSTNNERRNTFTIVKNVQLYGGFVGTEATLAERNLTITANKTTLSGDIGTLNDKTDNTYHVVMSIGDVETATIDGFTISNGFANEQSSTIIDGINHRNTYGAGIYNYSSSPTLSNLIITNNEIPGFYDIGGGIYNYASSPIITNVTITNNKAGYGGGIGSELASNPTLVNVTILENTGNSTGGGMYNNGSSPKLINVSISDNLAQRGAGIHNLDNSNPTFINISVLNNKASDGDGGILNQINCNPIITNSIIWGNTGVYYGDNVNNANNSTPIVTYSLIENKNNTANNGLNGLYSVFAPHFTDATNGDYSLLSSNAVINKGDNTAYNNAIGSLQGDKDLAGNPRIYQGIATNDVIDIGAYEFQGESTFIAEPINPSTDNILYVNKNATSGNKSGNSWANATPDLADALKYAKLNDNYTAVNPLKIFVAKGTYKPFYSAREGEFFGTNRVRANTFLLVKNVQIYGGFAGTETTLADRDLSLIANKSVLSGDIGIINDRSDNVYHVVVSSGNVETALLNGFTITDGNANYGILYNINANSFDQRYGGGIMTNNSSPTLTNISISNNYAALGGGGMGNVKSSPKLINVSISDNLAQLGAGVSNSTNSYPTFINVTVSNNKASSGGGGIYNDNNSILTLTNTIVWGNTGTSFGNNLYNDSGTSSIVTYSLIGEIDNTTNNGLDGTDIDNAPKFKDSANGDYTLLPTSLGVNIGNNAAYTTAGGDLQNDKDLAGNARVYHNTIDFGAYESQVLQINPDANNIIYVNKNVSGNTKTGNSWTNAVPELADALKWAKLQNNFTSSNPLKIFVAKGTYKPMYSPEDSANLLTNQNRDNTFLLVKNVQIYGGFAGTETALADRNLSLTANKSTLSGDIGVENTNTDNTYHVVVSSGNVENAVLNGFTLSGGNANVTSADIIINSNSFSKKNGGGLYTISSSPTITYVTISNNHTSNFGGGIFNKGSNAKFLNCIISDNNATDAVAIYNDNSSPSFTNVTIANNDTSNYEINIYNSNSFPTFNNCIIFNPTSAEIRNTNGSIPVYKNSLIGGLEDTSNGNIKSSMLTISDVFTDISNGDYSLALYSPAINRGDNTEYTTAGGDLQNDRDAAGNKRIYDGFSTIDKIDLGGIEYQGETITPNTNNIVFVDNSVSGGNKTGNSWANAVPELADALNYAEQQNNYTSSNPLKIFVAKGVYIPKYSPVEKRVYNLPQYPNRQKTFLLVKNVKIYGGFAGTETALAERDLTITANKTTLSGNVGTLNDKTDNTYHVVMSIGDVETAIIDGFTISNGFADQNYEQIKIKNLYFYNGDGAGIYNSSSSPTLSNLIITDNETANDNHIGGGIYNDKSSPLIRYVRITNNKSYYGGGIGSENNSNPTLLNVAIFENSSTNKGGGMYNINSSSPKLINVTILENLSYHGGGVYNDDSNPNFTNVTVSNNTANGDGGGIYNDDSNPTITNTIIWGNTAIGDGDNLFNRGSTPILTYSLVEYLDNSTNNGLNGTDVNNEPKFTDAANGDYTLLSTSPAINIGSNTLYTDAGGNITDKDLAGNARVFNGSPTADVIDMGAYELQKNPFKPAPTTMHATQVYAGNDQTLANLQVIGTAIKWYDTATAGSVLATTKDLVDGTTYYAVQTIDEIESTERLAITVKRISDAIQNKSKGNTVADLVSTPTTGKIAKWYTIVTGGTALNSTDILSKSTYYVEQYSIESVSNRVAVTVDLPPSVSTLSPADDATAITIDTNLVITFDENIAKGTGNIIIYDASDDSVVETIAVTATNVMITNAIATINPTSDLEKSKTYYVKIATTAFKNSAGNAFTGILDKTSWSFATELKTTPTITFANFTKTYGDANFNLGASSNSTGTVSYEIVAGGTGSASLSGTNNKTVTLGNTGTVSIKATIAADTNYLEASKTITFTITNATISGVTFANASSVFDGTVKSLTIAGTLPTGTSVSYADNSRTNVGTQEVTATISGTNYTTLVLKADLTITNATISGVTFTNASSVFDGTAKSLAIAGTLPTGTSVSYANNSRTNVGTQEVTATISGTNYTTLVLKADLTITNATITGVTFANASSVFDGTAKSLVIAGTLPTGTSVSYANNSRTNVGTQEVTATISGNNFTTLVLKADLTITNAAITGVTFANASSVFDGTAKSLVIAGTLPTGTSVSYANNSRTNVGTQEVTATISGNNFTTLVLKADLTITNATITGVAFANASSVFDGTAKSLVIAGTLPTGTSVSYANNSLTNVGTQEVTATISGNNFTTLELKADLTITNATITGVTFANASSVFDGTAKSLIIAGTLPTGTSVSYANNSRTNVGTQEVTATISGTNFTTLVLKADLTITNATITGVTFANASSVFDGTAKSLAIAGTLPTGTSVSYADNSRTNVGTQEVTATISGTNYITLVLKADLTITNATISGVTFANASSVFDGTAKSLAIAGTLPIGTSVSYANNSRTNVGTQEVTATISGNNYTTLVLKADLTITNATITVIADVKTKLYNAADPSLTYSLSQNLVGTDVFTGNLTRAIGSNVGMYAITQGSLSAGSNYAINFVGNTFEITPKEISITADATQNKVYGETDPTLTYTASEVLAAGNKFTGTLNRVNGEIVGTYTITKGSLSAGSNYVINFVDNTFEITKANQTITWTQTSELGCDERTTVLLTATSTSGLEVSYSSSNTNVATISNNVAQFSNYGSTMITASQAGNDNYNAASAVSISIVNSQPNLIRTHFDNLIFFDNSSNSFIAYSWYKNGVLVPGQTAQYFKDSEALNGTYYAIATKIDGSLITTCPLTISTSKEQEYLKIVPNPVRSNSNYQLITNVELANLQNASVVIYNMLGAKISAKFVNEKTIQMTAPNVEGIYIVRMTLKNGKILTKNLLVKNY